MSEVEGIVGIANEEIHKFRPRVIGGGSAILLFFALLAFELWLLVFFMGIYWSDTFDTGAIQGYANMLIPIGTVLLALAIAFIIKDKLTRCPPPAWVIEDELKMFLRDAFLLPDDSTLWKSNLKMRKPKFDRKSSCMTVWFYVRAAKATEDSFAKVKDGQAFRYAQDVEIKRHIDKRGYWDGYDLRIWYRPEQDVFNQLFRRVQP